MLCPAPEYKTGKFSPAINTRLPLRCQGAPCAHMNHRGPSPACAPPRHCRLSYALGCFLCLSLPWKPSAAPCCAATTRRAWEARQLGAPAPPKARRPKNSHGVVFCSNKVTTGCMSAIFGDRLDREVTTGCMSIIFGDRLHRTLMKSDDSIRAACCWIRNAKWMSWMPCIDCVTNPATLGAHYVQWGG